MKMCFNWKVVAGLAGVALVVYAVNPQLVLGALPLLLVAVCPLSMLFMGGMMGGMGNQNNQQGQQTVPAGGVGQYTCPMHPEVQSSQPGRCPKCGMNLVPVATPRPLTREEQLAQLRAQLQKVSDEQAKLAQQVEQLQVDEGTTASNKTIEEAEQIARAAEKRS